MTDLKLKLNFWLYFLQNFSFETEVTKVMKIETIDLVNNTV